jgi:hypothetical protein
VAARWARPWFAVTALCVLAGVALSVYSATVTPGRFHTGIERAFNTFAFFTIQSNLIAGGTALLLAIRLDRPSTVFRTFRLIGLVAITVTGLVYHVALASLFDLDGVHQLGNQLVHTVVPLLTVLGWLIFGPRGPGPDRMITSRADRIRMPGTTCAARLPASAMGTWVGASADQIRRRH